MADVVQRPSAGVVSVKEWGAGYTVEASATLKRALPAPGRGIACHAFIMMKGETVRNITGITVRPSCGMTRFT